MVDVWMSFRNEFQCGPADLQYHMNVIHSKCIWKRPTGLFQYIRYVLLKICITYHADFESVKKIKGQSGNQVDDEPGGHVMDADLSCVEDHLARLAHVCGAETEHYVWRSDKQSRRLRKIHHQHNFDEWQCVHSGIYNSKNASLPEIY